MNASTAAEQLLAQRVLAIVRLDDCGAAATAAEELARGGIEIIEFSLTAKDCLKTLQRVSSSDPTRLIGAGTVLDINDAKAACDAGARWLVSPNVDADVIAWSQEHDVLHIPGAFTPTEIASAQSHGAPLVKLFPARALGPRYINDLRGPFPTVRLVATGGVNRTNANEFLAAGAAAVALGSELVNADVVREPERLARHARELCASLQPKSVKEVRPCR